MFAAIRGLFPRKYCEDWLRSPWTWSKRNKFGDFNGIQFNRSIVQYPIAFAPRFIFRFFSSSFGADAERKSQFSSLFWHNELNVNEICGAIVNHGKTEQNTTQNERKPNQINTLNTNTKCVKTNFFSRLFVVMCVAESKTKLNILRDIRCNVRVRAVYWERSHYLSLHRSNYNCQPWHIYWVVQAKCDVLGDGFSLGASVWICFYFRNTFFCLNSFFFSIKVAFVLWVWILRLVINGKRFFRK